MVVETADNAGADAGNKAFEFSMRRMLRLTQAPLIDA